MTRVFTEAGESIPVTVIECTPNRVTQVKTVETDGYTAVQVAVGDKKPQRVNKALTGHYKKAGVAAGRGLWEFRITGKEGADLKPGSELKVGQFEGVKRVDVTGSIELKQEMVMPGDNVAVTVELINPIAMEEQVRFAIREGGRTVGAGVVTKILA